MSEPNLADEKPDTDENRRTAHRTQCYLEAAIADDEQPFVAATVLDLSAGGVKLLSQPPPAPGDELRLTFMANDGRLFQMEATVVHYIEHGSGWAVGCRFARQLNEQELEALL
jgi:hypothetical protein